MKAHEGFIRGGSSGWEPAGEGVRRKILGYDASLMMVHVEFAKGSVGALHSHPHRQVTFIERGRFEVQIGSRKEMLGPGDCYFIPAGIDHGVVALDEGALVDVFTPVREDFLSSGS